MNKAADSTGEEIQGESTDVLIDVKNTFDGMTETLNSFSDVESDGSSDTEIYSWEELELHRSDSPAMEYRNTPDGDNSTEEKYGGSKFAECCRSSEPCKQSDENDENLNIEEVSKPSINNSLTEASDLTNQSSRQKENELLNDNETEKKENGEEEQVLRQDYENMKNIDVVVPLIGKREFPATIDKPFAHRYDLAMERNRRKCEEQKEEAKIIMAFKKRQDARTPEEVELYKRLEKISAMQKASYLTKIAIRILREITNDQESFDEDYVMKYFIKFMNIPVSYLALIYAPHLVHTVMYIRGCDAFSLRIRRFADECYWKCHALFGIPDGYNFQTVYASEVKKYGLKEMGDCMMDEAFRRDYGDFDSDDEHDKSDSEDSAFFDLDSNDV